MGAGVGRMPIQEYVLDQSAAGLVWNFAWAFAALQFGRRVTRMVDRFGISTVLLGLLAAVVALGIWRVRRRGA